MNPPAARFAARSAAEAATATRRKRLMIASGLTLAATVWAALQGDDTPPASASLAAGTTRKARAVDRAVDRPTGKRPPTAGWPTPPDGAGRPAWSAAWPQGVAAWSGLAATTAVAVPPTRKAIAMAAAPQAPPFPYTLIGRLDDGEPRALLSGPLRSFGAKVSEVIDGQWRLDAVSANGVTLTWLPGSLQKSIAFPAP